MNYVELMVNLKNHGKELDVRSNKTKELIDCTINVNKFNLVFHMPFRDIVNIKKYLKGELSWYMSGSLDSEFIVKYSTFWSKLTNDQGKLNSNYGYHVFYKTINDKDTPFTWCVNQLLNDKFSRQAIILYNDNMYFYYGNKDFICTQLQHFLIRDNKLISLVYIRSSDLILGLTYDIPWWSLVQQQLLLTLKDKYPTLELGELIIHGGSFHFYDNKKELINNMLKYDKHFYFGNLILKKIIPLHESPEWYEKNIYKYIEIKENNVKNNIKEKSMDRI